VDQSLIDALHKHLEKRYGSDKAMAERFFMYGYSAFREGVDKTNLPLPKGQLTHVLRHTFASHFIMNGGNILVAENPGTQQPDDDDAICSPGTGTFARSDIIQSYIKANLSHSV